MNSKNIAVVLAGGVGSRTGFETPKQFLKIDNKTILEYSLDIFDSHKGVDEVCIVAREEYHNYIFDIIKRVGYKKIKAVLNAGNERYESTLSALDYYKDYEDSNLIIHDSARPLITSDIIDSCIEALKKYNAITVAIPVSDTIVEIEDNYIENMPNREIMYANQTPQCFRVSILKVAYKKALSDKNFKSTDDCKVVHQYLDNEKVYIVKGSTKNIKFTNREDLQIIELLMKL